VSSLIAFPFKSFQRTLTLHHLNLSFAALSRFRM